MEQYYETTHANVHRGVYATAEEATNHYEGARLAAGRFIGAPDPAREVSLPRTPPNPSTWWPTPGAAPTW